MQVLNHDTKSVFGTAVPVGFGWTEVYVELGCASVYRPNRETTNFRRELTTILSQMSRTKQIRLYPNSAQERANAVVCSHHAGVTW